MKSAHQPVPIPVHERLPPQVRSYPVQPCVYSRLPTFVGPLFSYSYELLFPQPLYFDNDLNCPGGDPASVSKCRTKRLNPFLLITSLQTQQFHAITHSFAQRRAAIHFIIKSLRTLLLSIGGGRGVVQANGFLRLQALPGALENSRRLLVKQHKINGFERTPIAQMLCRLLQHDLRAFLHRESRNAGAHRRERN